MFLDNQPIGFSAAMAALPPLDEGEARALYKKSFESFKAKFVILDDDPTGVQTVSGISVYTDWRVKSLEEGLKEASPLYYVLTNSRGMTRKQTEGVHHEIMQNLGVARQNTGVEAIVLSRSDSTLRGHYPLETQVISEELGGLDFEIITPFFPEGGRYTLGGVHYVLQGDDLIPASMTEFAKDMTFGYKNAYLPKWVEEKTKGAVPADEVTHIGLDLIRTLDVEAIKALLMPLNGFAKVTCDAASYGDLMVVGAALVNAFRAGKRFTARTAAALVRVLGDIDPIPPLGRDALLKGDNPNGGLIIVGSHVKRTSEQLQGLLTLQGTVGIEMDQHTALTPGGLEGEAHRVLEMAQKTVATGKTAVVYTRRERLDLGEGQEEELKLAMRISDAITSIVERMTVRPRFLIAKGGITSSEIGVRGLGVKRALVLGQAAPGVPVWETGPESRFPGMRYIIFPGNVGTADTLKKIVGTLI